MTTLVALNTMDGLVLGCDSLATETRRMVDPFELGSFFERDAQGFLDELKIGPDGKAVLKFHELYQQTQEMPFNHMTRVDKLFPLAPLDIGVMFSGITAIGARTVKSIIEEFKDNELPTLGGKRNYTLNEVSERLLVVLRGHYSQAYPYFPQPELELMIGGYDAQVQTPCIVRLNVKANDLVPSNYAFGAYFGAQRSEMMRVVFGTDAANMRRIEDRHAELLEKYRATLQNYLSANQSSVQLPRASAFPENFSIFGENWTLEGLGAQWGEFSIQNAIDSVDFLINIMIRSHQFKSQLPSVGGPIQLGVIQKNRGFKYVSERVWRHEGHVTPIED